MATEAKQVAAKTGKRTIPLAVARLTAERVCAHLEPYCERVAIAGSIRRGKATVGDIEIVAIPKRIERPITNAPQAQQLSLFGQGASSAPPNPTETVSLLDEEVTRMVAVGMLRREPPRGVLTTTAWGPKYKKLWLPVNYRWGYVQLDLFCATRTNWGAIFAIRTGSGAFSTALQTYINRQTPYRQAQGALTYMPTGEAVATPTERSYFAHVGVRWIAPHRRDARAAQHLYALRWPGEVGYNESRVRAAIRDRLERGW